MGLSALLVPTNWGNARAFTWWDEQQHGSTFFCIQRQQNPKATEGPGGTTEIRRMARNVFIASFAFFIPLPRLRRRYRRQRGSRSEVTPPFAHYPNANCSYRLLSDVHSDSLTGEHTFFFRSCPNGTDEAWRQVGIKPFLAEFRLRRQRLHVLVLLASLDKVFPDAAEPYSNADFCTESDLVSLKKAFLGKGENGLHAGRDAQSPDIHEWLTALLRETASKSYSNLPPVYSVADVRVQKLAVTRDNNDSSALSAAFQQAYHHASDTSVDDFLNRPVAMCGPTRHSVSGRDFIHGLLYANDNFMMLPETPAAASAGDGFTNNRTEKFWADGGSIVRLSVHAPFFRPRWEESQQLTGRLGEVQCLPEMCLLLYMKRRLAELKTEHRNLKATDIERRRGELAACLHEPLFNLTETDRLMDYFKEQFGLDRSFEDTLAVALPRKNVLETIFNHTTGIIALVIATLTLLADLFSKLFEK